MIKVAFLFLFIIGNLISVQSQNVKAKVFLQGAYLSGSSMDTSLGASIPLSQPFNEDPWNYYGNEHLNSIPGNMVDWVIVELRDNSNPSLIKGRRAALLMENGLITDTNLQSSVNFGGLSSGQYYLCIYHRNHIPVMSANPILVPNAVAYDFSDTLNYPPYGGGSLAMIELETGIFGMIAGDVNKDGILKYSGPENDRGAVLQYIIMQSGSPGITSTVQGYSSEDVNMDSIIKYSGPGNDPSLIIQNLVSLNASSSITSVYNSRVPAAVSSFQCGDSLLDQRDGKRYLTVQIGDQCWMAENLNYGTKISGMFNQSDNGIYEKYCYEDDDSRCIIYGGLYQWDEMMDYNSNPGSSGICPSGWHIPTDDEWKILEGSVDSQYGIGDPHWDLQGNRGFDAACNLIETGNQNWPVPNPCATNSSGYSARPGGCLFFTGVFYYFSVNAYFWTSTEQNLSNAWYRNIFNNSNLIERTAFFKSRAYSVRCVLN